MNKYRVKAGRTLFVGAELHDLEGKDAGEYIFHVTGLDVEQHIQWSINGASLAHFEKSSSEDKTYSDICVITIPKDQWTSEARVVNVSVIGTDIATKELVDTKATLTLTIVPEQADTDFHLVGLDFPKEFTYNIPADKFSPNESIATVEVNKLVNDKNFHGYVTVDLQGDYVTPNTYYLQALDNNNNKMISKNVSFYIERVVVELLDKKPYLEYLNGTITAEVWYRPDENAEDEYYHARGDTFLVKITRTE